MSAFQVTNIQPKRVLVITQRYLGDTLLITPLLSSLKKAYPDYNFVPVYWMATEDHDFAEINHFSLFGKKYEWNTEQKGAVGRMNPKELETLISEFQDCPEV